MNDDSRIVKLRVDNLILNHEIEELKHEFENNSCSINCRNENLRIEKLVNNEQLFTEYTGLCSMNLFLDIHQDIHKEFRINIEAEENVEYIQSEDQLLMTLMRLKCNFSLSDLSVRFGFRSIKIKDAMINWINYLHNYFYENRMKIQPFPFYANEPLKLPKCFNIFTNSRIIIGVVNIIFSVSWISDQNYGKELKKKQLRGIVGLSPMNEVIFASDLYPEEVQLTDIILQSELLLKLSPGDSILSEVNLNLDHILPLHVEFNRPLYLDESHRVNDIPSRIAVACQGVSDVIKKLQTYAVLDRYSAILNDGNLASMVFQICCCLINLDPSFSSRYQN